MTTFSQKENPSLESIEVSELADRLPETMEKVSDGGEEIIITQNGEPISRLTRYATGSEHRPQRLVFGQHRYQIHILGDIVSPMPSTWYGKDDDKEDLY